MFAGEANRAGRVVRPEHLRQHALGEARGQRPLVGVLLLRQFRAFGQGDRDAQFRLDQQVVLGQEAGEQHAVRVLKGALVYHVIDRLRSRIGAEPVAELPGVGAQPQAQGALRAVHVLVGLGFGNGERLQRRPGAGLGDVARLHDGALQPPAQVR